ncbi:hypothetical protein LZ30DRAFT_483960 [Colletotrichum cereale]|nr:hypothetical protein LZ30DRAFT_483960 [Colletotrichum cereale]
MLEPHPRRMYAFPSCASSPLSLADQDRDVYRRPSSSSSFSSSSSSSSSSPAEKAGNPSNLSILSLAKATRVHSSRHCETARDGMRRDEEPGQLGRSQSASICCACSRDSCLCTYLGTYLGGYSHVRTASYCMRKTSCAMSPCFSTASCTTEGGGAPLFVHPMPSRPSPPTLSLELLFSCPHPWPIQTPDSNNMAVSSHTYSHPTRARALCFTLPPSLSSS